MLNIMIGLEFYNIKNENDDLSFIVYMNLRYLSRGF